MPGSPLTPFDKAPAFDAVPMAPTPVVPRAPMPPAILSPRAETPRAPMPSQNAPDFVRQMLPVAMSALMGGNNPHATAAGLAGMMRGREMRRQQTEDAQTAQQRKQLEAAKFYHDVLTAANGYDDENQLQQELAALAPIAQHYGIDLRSIHVSDTKKVEKAKKEAQATVEQLRKVYGADVDNPEWRKGKSINGRSVDDLFAAAQTPVPMQNGQAVAPTLKPNTDPLAPNTSEEQFYATFAKEQGKASFGELTTAQQAQARKQWMQADDYARQSGNAEISGLRADLLRTQVDAANQKAGEGAQKQALAKRAAQNTSQATLDVLDQLITVNPDGTTTLKPGVGNLFGMRMPYGDLVPGTATANASSALERLKGRIIVDLIAEMKQQSRTGATGFGALTERELRLLENAATQLSSRNISDTRAADELKRIYDIAQAALQESSAGEAPAAAAPAVARPSAAKPAPAPAQAPPAPAGWKYVPKPGGGWTAVEAR